MSKQYWDRHEQQRQSEVLDKVVLYNKQGADKQRVSLLFKTKYVLYDTHVIFEDGVFYQGSEVACMRGKDADAKKCVHEIKRVFGNGATVEQ